jgi:hypothetical protein
VTPADEALSFAWALQGAFSRVLGEQIAAVILHGSLTFAEYVPGFSDVDLLIIVDAPLSNMQLAALTDVLEAERELALGLRADLRVVTRRVAAAPTPAPPVEASFEIGYGPEAGLRVESRLPREDDLVVDLSMSRAHGRSLSGAPPAELIGEVPAAWVVSVGMTQLAEWLAAGDRLQEPQHVVLSACRIWLFAEEFRHSSKTAAGRWALARDPSLQAVRHALYQRHCDPTGSIDSAALRDFLTLVSESQRSESGQSPSTTGR